MYIITQFIADTLDDAGQMNVIYTNFSKAFHSVDQEMLLNNYQFLDSYFFDRKLKLYFKLKAITATYSIPKGSF